MMDMIILETEERMQNAIEHFKGQLAKISTGRATTQMLDSVYVEYYGDMTQLSNMASLSISEGRQIVIKPYDKSTVKDIDAAIRKADLGFNPNDEGDLLRINVPPLTEETRRRSVKTASEKAEDAKIEIRKARQSGNDDIKNAEGATEDMIKGYQEDIQNLTNKYNKIIDEMRDEKEKQIMTI